MKVGIITDSIDIGGGGIKVYAEELVKNITNIDKKNKYILIHCKKKSFYKRFNELIISLRKRSNLGIFFRKMLVLPRKLSKHKFDVIHETNQIGPYLWRCGKKQIVTIHDIGPLAVPDKHVLLNVLFHKIFLPITAKNADAIITISKFTKKEIIKHIEINPNKIKVIYDAADKKYKVIKNKNMLAKFRERYRIKTPFILFIGTIEPRKNISGLIKAFNAVKDMNKQVKLVIVGKLGWKYKDVFQTIKKLKIQDRVIFTGPVPGADLPLFYNCAEMFVFPSHYEGFGLPPLEAMACGCPVITSNTSSLPEVVGNAAIKVKPKDIKGISNAILKVMSSKKTRSAMIKKGLKQVKKFSWRKCAEETLKVYLEK